MVAVLAVLAAVSSHYTLTHRCRPWVDMCFLAGFDVTVEHGPVPFGRRETAQKMSDPETARRQSGPYLGTLAVSWDPQSPYNPQYDVALSFSRFLLRPELMAQTILHYSDHTTWLQQTTDYRRSKTNYRQWYKQITIQQNAC